MTRLTAERDAAVAEAAAMRELLSLTDGLLRLRHIGEPDKAAELMHAENADALASPSPGLSLLARLEAAEECRERTQGLVANIYATQEERGLLRAEVERLKSRLEVAEAGAKAGWENAQAAHARVAELSDEVERLKSALQLWEKASCDVKDLEAVEATIREACALLRDADPPRASWGERREAFLDAHDKEGV